MDTTQLQTQSGDYIITIGQYSTMAEANAALKTLEGKFSGNTTLFVASGLADDMPEK